MNAKEAAFKQAAVTHLGRADNLSRADLFAVRDASGVSIPNTVWTDCKTDTRGVFDLNSFGGGVAASINRNNIAALLGMDMNEKTGAVTLAGGALQLVERADGGKFKNPSPAYINDILSKQVSTPAESKRDSISVRQLFADLNDLVELVANGAGRSLYTYGTTGSGKTHVVFDRLRKMGLKKNVDYFVVKGSITTSSLYQTLFMHRKGAIIVFDDCDSAFDNADSANILKAALDSYEDRYISWFSNRTINVSMWDDDRRALLEAKIDSLLRGYVDEETKEEADDAEVDDVLEEDDTDKHLAKLRRLKFPSEFKFESGVIFISNLSASDIDEAVLSRSFKIDMSLNSAQMFDRIEDMLDQVGDKTLTKAVKQDILKTLRDKHALGKLAQPNMRTFVAACNIVKSGAKNWQSLIQYT